MTTLVLHVSHDSLHTCFGAILSQYFNCSLKPNSAQITLKTASCLQLLSRNGKEAKAIQIHTCILFSLIHTLTKATCHHISHIYSETLNIRDQNTSSEMFEFSKQK